MAEQFVNHTWVCGRCRATFVERFHLKTDGDPNNADPPKDWQRVTESGLTALLCPTCVTRREEVSRRAMSITAAGSKTYINLTREQAVEKWTGSHICLECFHLDVCRYAPVETAAAQRLVAISLCRSFKSRMGFPRHLT